MDTSSYSFFGLLDLYFSRNSSSSTGTFTDSHRALCCLRFGLRQFCPGDIYGSGNFLLISLRSFLWKVEFLFPQGIYEQSTKTERFNGGFYKRSAKNKNEEDEDDDDDLDEPQSRLIRIKNGNQLFKMVQNQK